MKELGIDCLTNETFVPVIEVKPNCKIELSIFHKNGNLAYKDLLSYARWIELVLFSKRIDKLNESAKKEPI